MGSERLASAKRRRAEWRAATSAAYRSAVERAGLGVLPPDPSSLRLSTDDAANLYRVLPVAVRDLFAAALPFIPRSVTSGVSRRSFGDPLEQAEAQEALNTVHGTLRAISDRD